MNPVWIELLSPIRRLVECSWLAMEVVHSIVPSPQMAYILVWILLVSPADHSFQLSSSWLALADIASMVMIL